MTKPADPEFPVSGESVWDSGMTLRQYAAIKAMQGLLANSGGPIQANGRTGWGLVNCTPQNIAVAAVDLADALLLELDREPDNQEDKLSEVSKQ